MKVYFAHPVSSYGTAQEQALIEGLKNAGFDVVNPNEAPHQNMVRELKEKFNEQGSVKIMEYFVELCSSCDSCAVLPFPNGK